MSDFNPDQYLEEKGTGDFNPDTYLSEKKDSDPAGIKNLEQNGIIQPGSVLSDLPKTYGKVMGYLSGNLRNAGAQYDDTLRSLLEKATGQSPQPRLTRDGDTLHALNGDAPKTEDYLNRMGVKNKWLSDSVPGYVEPGSGGLFKPEKHGMLDFSKNGVLGGIGDLVSDAPTMMVGNELSLAGKANKGSALLKDLLLQNQKNELSTGGKFANLILNPLDLATAKGATSAYQGAFAKPDAMAAKMGKTILPSKIAEDTGFVGGGKKFVDQIKATNDKAGPDVGNILKQASDKGAVVNTYRDLFPKLAQKASDLFGVGVSEKSAAADQLVKRGQEFFDAKGPITSVSAANETKSALNELNRYGQKSDVDSISEAARKGVANPLSDLIKDSVNNTDPELYKKLLKANETYSATSPAVQDMMTQWSSNAANSKSPLALSKVDWGLLGAALTGHPVGIGAFAAKKVGDAVNSTQGRTAVGYGLKQLSKSNGVLDEMLRQAIVDHENKQNGR